MRRKLTYEGRRDDMKYIRTELLNKGYIVCICNKGTSMMCLTAISTYKTTQLP